MRAVMPVPWYGGIMRRKLYLVTEEVNLVFPSVQAPKARRSASYVNDEGQQLDLSQE